MAARLAHQLPVALVALACAAPLALASSSSTAASCSAAQLRGTMAVIPGSAGAGNIVYALRLRNAGRAACVVSGRPALLLLSAHGKPLPTHVLVSGAATAVLVRLAPGAVAVTQLRFSPDVPGVGEPAVSGGCEAVAHAVRVTLASPGHGTLRAPIRPPTRVCEHGRMSETNLSRS